MTARIVSVGDDFILPASVKVAAGNVGDLTPGDVGAATAAQGALADTAVQPADIGTAAAQDVDAFVATGSLVVNVKDAAYGATGDGVTDDTAAVAAAITAAAGHRVYFPPGTYLIDSLTVGGAAYLNLDDAAVLKAKAPSATNKMIAFSGSSLKIRGGTIDGNRANQTGRTYLIFGDVQAGKSIDVEGVTFTGSVASCVYAAEFGGYINMSRNTHTDQAQHDGVNGHFTSILYVASGEVGSKGLIRFNHNRALSSGTPTLPGAWPGGIFVNTQAAGVSDGVGNLSTLEAIGNHFVGYGQNCAGNDISALHTYPTLAGMRVIGNYFEGCGFSAISAKSVQDFVCTGNVILNGAYDAQHISTEGAISYAPGYHAEAYQRPRAVITGNIVTDPGGQSVATKQVCIAVRGTVTSTATDVVVAQNVLTRGGYGIYCDRATGLVITGNRVTGASDGTSATEMGIRVANATGTVMIAHNVVDVSNGAGVQMQSTNPTAQVHLLNNTVNQSGTGACADIRGVAYLKVSGNSFDAPSGKAYWLTADASANPIGHLAWDQSNTIRSGSRTLTWAGVTKATGVLTGAGSPQGSVTPGEIGTVYRQVDGKPGGVLWTAMGVTSTSWAESTDRGTAGSAPSVVVHANAGSGASATIVGTDSVGIVTINPGTSPAIGTQATVTFAQQRSGVPLAVILTPANNTATATATSMAVLSTSLATTGFALSGRVAFTGTNPHIYYYRVF